MSLEDFEFASGSAMGSEHLRRQENNQDGYRLIRDGEVCVAVVTDGCGGAPHSEVGAKAGAYFMARLLKDCADKGVIDDDALKDVVFVANNMLTYFIDSLDLSREDADKYVMEYLLFTIVAVVIAHDEALFLQLGDGTVFINGDPYRADFDNRPPYLAYNLIEGHEGHSYTLSVIKRLPLAELNHFMIATDGVDYLSEARGVNREAARETARRSGGPEQFWADDVYFKRDRAVTARLSKLSKYGWSEYDDGHGGIQVEESLLKDDSTLIVGRRKLPLVGGQDEARQ